MPKYGTLQDMQDLLTTADVAARLDLTTAAVTYRVRRGLLKPVAKAPGVRGAFLFDPDYVDQVVTEELAAREERKAS